MGEFIVMGNLIRMAKGRFTPLLGACVLFTGGISASVLLGAGTAQAVPCPVGPEAAGTACTITGTLVITSGTLTLTAPPALGWTETVNGLDQTLVDPTVADQTYQVNDATGTAPGWHVTIAATQFATAGSTHTLADAGTFSTNGSLAAMTDATAPTAACTALSTCTLPTDGTTYPVAITTGAAVTPVNIYDAAALTGLGTITIGSPGADPVGWWLNVPSNTIQGTYTSTVSLELISGP
jgi:WxL domain surface cell wall-binding